MNVHGGAIQEASTTVPGPVWLQGLLLIPSSFSVSSLSASVPLVCLGTLGTVAQIVVFLVRAMEPFSILKLASNASVFKFWIPKPSPTYSLLFLLPVGEKTRAVLRWRKFLFLAAPCGVRALWTVSPHCSCFSSLLLIEVLPEQILDIVLKKHLKSCLSSAQQLRSLLPSLDPLACGCPSAAVADLAQKFKALWAPCWHAQPTRAGCLHGVLESCCMLFLIQVFKSSIIPRS